METQASKRQKVEEGVKDAKTVEERLAHHYTIKTKCYTIVLHVWGVDYASCETGDAAFSDERTAWKNVFREEFLKNMQRPPRQDPNYPPVDMNKLNEQKEKYTKLYLHLVHPDWMFTQKFRNEWERVRDQYLRLLGTWAYNAGVQENVLYTYGGGKLQTLNEELEQLDAKVRLGTS
jgi:hypothetical protein